MLEATWWGGIFLLGVPVMALLLVLGPILLPSRPEAAARRRIDLASTAIALGAVLPTIWGLKELARGGVAVAACPGDRGRADRAGVVFVRRQLRLPEPMLDLRLFAVPTVAYGLGANLLTGVVMAGSSLLASLYLQTVAGLSPLQTAWWLVPQTVAMIIGFQVAPLVTKRVPALVVVAIGFGLAGAGLGLLGTVTPSSGPLLVAGALTVASFGIAGPMTVLQTLIMTAAPPERAGSAAGVNETSSEFGIALGIALLGSLAAAVTGTPLAGGSRRRHPPSRPATRSPRSSPPAVVRRPGRRRDSRGPPNTQTRSAGRRHSPRPANRLTGPRHPLAERQVMRSRRTVPD